MVSWQFSIGQDIQLSHQRGFYETPFNLSITSAIQNATIRYTLDGSEPTDQHGEHYVGNIDITTTTVIRVFAYNNVDTTLTVTHTYLFLQDVINQPNFISGYPAQLEMDPDVVDDPLYTDMMESVLKKIPSLSIAISLKDFNDPNTGIHANPLKRGSDWERKSSFELINVDGSSGFFVQGGLRIHGGASRTRRKKTFRILFKGQYGYSKLDYNLFGPGSNKSIDGLVLRSRGGNSYVHSDATHRERSQYLRDHIANELYRDMDNVSTFGLKVHLYINGIYWGLYNTVEYLHDNYHAAYFGGNETDYDVYNHSGLENGDNTAWLHAINLANAGLSTSAQWNAFKKEIDVSNLFDYMILNHYGGNTDWDNNNWYAAKKRDTTGRWRFFPWDSEQFFKEKNINVTTKNNAGKPTNLFNKALENDEALIAFQDKVHCYCFDDGILTPNKVDSIWMHEFEKFDIAMIGESARWGDDQTPNNPYTYFNEAITEQGRLRNNYFPVRTDILLDQYRSNAWFTNFDGVVYNKNGGTVSSGFQLILSNPNASGTIYFTTDGSDPRLPGGAISSTAIQYSQSFPISNSQTIKARVKSGSNWSAMCPKDFYISQNYSNVVINEIHYHPLDSIMLNDTISGRNFEFIEIHNEGNFASDLSGVQFSDGVDFIFPMGSIIQPDQYIVIAEDNFWFTQRYGFTPFGRYTNKLNNGGERIALSDPLDQMFDEVIYDDVPPWSPDADGLGYSLALIEGVNNSLPSSWNIQSTFLTPGSKNLFCTPITINPFAFNVSCLDGDDGFLQVSASGGTFPYQFDWSNGTSGTSISNLTAGNYTVTVTDANECTETGTWTLTQPASAVNVSVSKQNQTQYNVNNGSATASGSGGTPDYSYSWSTGSSSATINNLAPGNYTITVMDDNDCTDTQSVTINPVNCVVNANVTHDDLSYFDANDGSATASGSGGPTPYFFSWSNGSLSATINNLSPGNYTVTVTASNGCFDTQTVTIDNVPCSFTASATHTDLSYFDANDGSATASGSGEPEPFSFNWSNGSTAATINNLSPGTYTVTVTSSNNCSDTQTLVIDNVPCSFTASATHTDLSYFDANDGSATASGSGEPEPFSFNWSNGSTTATINNLSPGSYTVTVTSSNNCSDTQTLVIDNVPCSFTASATHTDLSYFDANDGSATASGSGEPEPYSFNWSNGSTTATINNLSPGSYTVTVTSSNNCSDTQTLVIDNVPCSFTASATHTDLSYFDANDGSATASGSGEPEPYSFNWLNGSTTATINNLSPGTYTVTVTSSNNCSDTQALVIDNVPCSFIASATHTDVTYLGSNNGTATASGSGEPTPYSFAWSNGANTATINNLSPGSYTVTVTSSNNCSDTHTLVIDEVSCALISNTTHTDITFFGSNNGTATASATDGPTPYSFVWSNGANTASISNLAPGNYNVTVTAANGCFDVSSLTIDEVNCSSFSLNLTKTDETYLNNDDGSATANPVGYRSFFLHLV